MKNGLLRINHAALTILACIMCQFALSARAASHDISMTADGFVPSYLEVTVGDRVYWWNEDYDFFDTHSTHSYTYPWNSGPIAVNYGVYLDTTKTGTYDYTDDWSFSGWGTLVIKPAGPPPPPTPTFISAPNRVDMVYDQGRDILYITSGTNVLRYQLSSDSFLEPFQLSGSVKGLDLSPDGNTLVVADASATSSNVWVHVINLSSGQSSKAFFPSYFSEQGTFAVAFGGDGAALVTSQSSLEPLRRYDPATGLTTTIPFSVYDTSMVSSSGDGTTIVIAESDVSNGPVDLYDVATRTVTRRAETGHFNYECGASKDGSLFALPTYFGTIIYDHNFNQVTNIGAYAGLQPIGAAFHPSADAVFFPFARTNYVRAYNTTTWEVLAQYNFQTTFTTPGNHAFTNGRIRISPDGQIIFVTVSGGVSYLRHGLSLPLTHRLLIAGSPAPYGSPTPVGYGSYWLSDGTGLTISVPAVAETNGTAAICRGWTGTGSAAGSGTGTDVSFTLTANTILTWNWAPLALSVTPVAGNQLVLQWPSADGTSFDVLFATDLLGVYAPVASDLPATPPLNEYQITIGSAGAGFYKVRMK